MTDQRRIDAAHEAGHVVAAWLLGREPLLVTLDGPTGTPCAVDRPRDDHTLPIRHAAVDEAVIALAGPLCERFADEVADV
jgi:hypothetical protein